MANKEIDRDLKRHFSALFSSRLKNIVPGPNMYKEIRNFTGSRSTMTIGCMKDSKGNLVRTPEEVAVVFRDYYSEIFKEQAPPHVLPSAPSHSDPKISVETATISHLIKSLNGK